MEQRANCNSLQRRHSLPRFVSLLFSIFIFCSTTSAVYTSNEPQLSYVCRLCHMKHAGADAIAVQTVQTQRLPLQFIAISGCCCLFVCALWRVFNAPSRSFFVAPPLFRHLCYPQFNCMSLYAVTFSIVSTSFHLHRRASVMRTPFYSEVKYDTQLKWRSKKKLNANSMSIVEFNECSKWLTRRRFTHTEFALLNEAHIQHIFDPHININFSSSLFFNDENQSSCEKLLNERIRSR